MKTYISYSLLYLFFFSNIGIANNDNCAFNDESITPAQTKNAVKIDSSGNLIYTDIIGVNDDISIVLKGTNYRLSNTAVALTAGNKIKQDGNAVLVSITSVTGKIVINTEGGDDTFTVDFSGGNIKNEIIYNGGGQNTPTGDDMVLVGANHVVYDTVTHTFVNNSDGFVDITENNRISYIGLEPITDNMNAANRVFTFTGNLANTEEITLEAGGTLGNRIDSNYGESVDFTRPTNSLTINTTGFGDDILEIKGLSLGNADLTVNGGDGDEIRFSNNAISLGGGKLNLTGHEIHFLRNVSANTITTTSRSVTAIESASVTATNGSLTMSAGTVVPPIDGVNTDTGGLYMNFGIIETRNSHDININATTYAARNIINQSSLAGFSMENSSIITRFGDITITGSGIDLSLIHI